MKKLIRTSDGITIEIPQNEDANGAYANQLVDAERAKRKQSYVTKSNENFDKEQDQRAIRFEERELDGEMGMEAIDNAPESAINVGKGIYDVAKNVIASPLESLESVGDVAVGGLANASDTYRDYVIAELEKARDEAFNNYERLDNKADAVGDYYSKRLGGWKEIKQTMAEDPFGFLLDASGMTGILKSTLKQSIKQPYKAVTKITGTKNPKLEAVGRQIDEGAQKVVNATNPLSW